VVRICNDQAICDITPMVIRAYAVKQEKRTAQMEQASIADVVKQMEEMKKDSNIGPFATIYMGNLEIPHATIERLGRLDQGTIADKAQIIALSVQGQ